MSIQHRQGRHFKVGKPIIKSKSGIPSMPRRDSSTNIAREYIGSGIWPPDHRIMDEIRSSGRVAGLEPSKVISSFTSRHQLADQGTKANLNKNTKSSAKRKLEAELESMRKLHSREVEQIMNQINNADEQIIDQKRCIEKLVSRGGKIDQEIRQLGQQLELLRKNNSESCWDASNRLNQMHSHTPDVPRPGLQKGFNQQQINRVLIQLEKSQPIIRSSAKKPKAREQCEICCSVLQQYDRMCELKCLHRFHSVCIGDWLKTNKLCPACQCSVEP